MAPSPRENRRRPIRKMLIANRGEIAVRVIRACRELGIRSVAVFSDADRRALHVLRADEAIWIGAAPAKDSYLDSAKVIEAARRAGAEAIHPGYGFLSEKADFARAVAEAGLVFIGPPPEAMEAMGHKTRARQTMQAAGVPVVPGDNGPEGRGFPTADEALAAAQGIGFPVMLKAAAGGGGRGMRLVDEEKKFEAAYQAARREAKGAFGDDTVYLERAVMRPRHVEVQVFGDAHGNVVHLFERDCSIQRRHQKVIEESPSPAVAPDLRRRMGEVACQAARAVSYVGAGTCEFLLSADQQFYFLEMNTRLQVEHPVTEMITQVDLVRLQIAVAEGQWLPFAQADLAPRGAAIECRIYAEDPVRFLPSPGVITELVAPAGPFVRDDSGVYAGAEISVYYDPMISKLVAWGETRAQAIERMARALAEYRVGGIKTNLPFHRRVMQNRAFLVGDYDTSFIDANKAELCTPPPPPDGVRDDLLAAAAIHALAEAPPLAPPAASGSISAWRQRARW